MRQTEYLAFPLVSARLLDTMTTHHVEAMIVGVAQDGGVPQVGCTCSHCQAARLDESLRRLAASLAIISHETQEVWLLDATPDVREQVDLLVSAVPGYRLAGILLTHAHIGHVLGLAFLGREAWNRRNLPVFGTRRMINFLRKNQPWKQLVDLENIVPTAIEPDQPVCLGPTITATPILVAHRDEISDTVAFSITGPHRRLIYCPDIDRWEGPILGAIADADIALLDGTFYSADELPDRSISEVPHPCVADSIETFKNYDTDIQFIHLNHSNRLFSDESLVEKLRAAGFGIGERGDILNL